jgi:hypothetical protein
MKISDKPVDVEKYYAKKTVWDLPEGTVLIPTFRFRVEHGVENRLVRLWQCSRRGEVTGEACRQCFISGRAAHVEGQPVEYLSRPMCKEANAVALAGQGTFQVLLVDMGQKVFELSVYGKDVVFSFEAVLMLVNNGYLKLLERKPVEF